MRLTPVLLTIFFVFILTNCSSRSSSFTGTWVSENGELVLVQSGNTVTGEYEYDSGHIQGTVEGKTLSYRWWENINENADYESTDEQERGEGYFTLSEDNMSISGEWRYDGDQIWRERWSAERKN